jgi:hypothetical protein
VKDPYEVPCSKQQSELKAQLKKDTADHHACVKRMQGKGKIQDWNPEMLGAEIAAECGVVPVYEEPACVEDEVAQPKLTKRQISERNKLLKRQRLHDVCAIPIIANGETKCLSAGVIDEQVEKACGEYPEEEIDDATGYGNIDTGDIDAEPRKRTKTEKAFDEQISKLMKTHTKNSRQCVAINKQIDRVWYRYRAWIRIKEGGFTSHFLVSRPFHPCTFVPQGLDIP